jgi:hypothetical protein
VYACGHELGHWHFDHGSTVEDLQSLEMSKHLKPEDMLANTFASSLLAPPWAVKDAFERRSYELSTAGPVEVYSVCCQLGLGYQTLIRHLQYSLHLLSNDRADELLAFSPKVIREKVLGRATSGHLIITSTAWRSVPIDLRVGDVAIVPKDALPEGSAITEAGMVSGGKVIEGCKPGIAKVYCEQSSWAAYVRVSRQDYVGRAKYRHLEDPDVD